MKIYLYKWVDCISSLKVLIVNANNRKDADKKFEQWLTTIKEEDQPCSYSARKYELKENDVLFLERWKENVISL